MPIYIGGHPGIKTIRSFPPVFLKIEGNRLLIKGIVNVLGSIPLSSIKNVSIEDTSSQRFTATRLALLGPLALAFKKKSDLFVLVVEWVDEGVTHETIFKYEGFMPNKDINNDYRNIANARKGLMASSPPQKTAAELPRQEAPPAIEIDVQSKFMENLKQLKQLHDQGILTDTEFNSKKLFLLSQLSAVIAKMKSSTPSCP